MASGVDGGRGCRPSRDFLRHIANRVIAEYAHKLPATTVEDIRKRLSSAEDKFKFSIYGGDPARLLDYFESEEWAGLVDYAKNTHSEEVLLQILKRLAEEYGDECPDVASRALEEAERIAREGGKVGREELSVERIVRKLKLMGYKIDVEGSKIVIDEGIVKVEMRVEEEAIRYVIHREGVARSLDGVLAKLERIREI
ncbi:MAG: hypothetical protein F7B17_09390 [Desulfurococcales archaeon]|nr:hypothetical protein [Desulfurococcales archaeon]